MISVLIVEDDKLARKGLIHAMPWSEYGMAVVGEANCGHAALDFLEGRNVDLVLTDFSMPGMSGGDLIRIARQRFPRLAFVVLTFHQELEYAQEAFRLGALDYIAKIQLEKEGFDEVLSRIRDRFLEWQAGQGLEQSRASSSGEAASFVEERGYFLLFTEDDPDAGWARAISDERGWKLEATGSGMWLCAFGSASSAAAGVIAAAAGAKEGWALVELSGLAGEARESVVAALKKYRSSCFFYECGPGVGLLSRPLTEIEGCEGGRGEEELAALERSLLSFDWLFDDAAFASCTQDILKARPQPAKLSRLLVEIEGEWNRIFYPIAACRAQLPEPLASWRSAESWLRGLRAAAATGNKRLSYAGAVVASVMRAVCITEAEMGGQLLALDVARRVNMSRGYFCRCFKDIAGKPFNDYLQRTRVDRAKLLLANTEAQVGQVAEEVGYSDEKYFAKVFREQTGMPPSLFRQISREGRRSSSAK
jgi:two-component system response regulator YesN